MKHARNKIIFAVGLLAALSAPAFTAEDSFEGAIHYTLRSEAEPMQMIHFIKDSRMRIELPLDGTNTAVSIVDLTKPGDFDPDAGPEHVHGHASPGRGRRGRHDGPPNGRHRGKP